MPGSAANSTRWAEPWPVNGWEAGTDTTELRRLTAYWAGGYDRRAHEAAVNALPSHLADRLATPSRYGGAAEDAFTVIVPSLSGFAFSPQRPTLSDTQQTHHLWHRVMPGPPRIHGGLADARGRLPEHPRPG
ncbi:epoxide hydrolase N-terminal domain-containing protein [Streptomyces cynarae]|uniref:Epoxide hydrolase N-terminal domain-containing protein n=1 Tax=Streptomyces cynarae TaxID=2981134 RepID=A0ABY6DU42_9ACTN|nr:epoxide hydrolase N-terminal domain-containing protein [Streptomyces cynarae]UXY17895.1 epoxide hydrolase N-terminal domain-containing protein [Streptomyces cynarae]